MPTDNALEARRISVSPIEARPRPLEAPKTTRIILKLSTLVNEPGKDAFETRRVLSKDFNAPQQLHVGYPVAVKELALQTKITMTMFSTWTPHELVYTEPLMCDNVEGLQQSALLLTQNGWKELKDLP